MAGGIFELPRVERAGAWSRQTLRSLLAVRSERDRADLPLLTVARERGVFVRSVDDANHNTIPEDLSNYKVAYAGDLVINKMKAWQGSLGLAPVDGIVSPAYFVFNADFAVPRFGEYLLRSKPYVAKFAAASDGVRIGQWDLNIPRMRNIEALLPPPEEQAAIAKYLAHANARIDKAIAAKRRLISLLEEQQRVIVHQTIYQRVDSEDAPVVPIKRVLESMVAGVWGASPEESQETPIWCVRVADFDYGQNTIHSGSRTMRAVAEKDIERKLLRSGDLLLEGSGGGDKTSVGRVVMFEASEPAICSNFLQRLRTVNGVDSKYLSHVLRDLHASGAVRSCIKQTTGIQNLDLNAYRAILIPLPNFESQVSLSYQIEESLIENIAIVARINQEIQLLQEFRTRLVADVVTGQVDVRVIAATLPDVPTPVAGSANATTELDDQCSVSKKRKQNDLALSSRLC